MMKGQLVNTTAKLLQKTFKQAFIIAVEIHIVYVLQYLYILISLKQYSN